MFDTNPRDWYLDSSSRPGLKSGLLLQHYRRPFWGFVGALILGVQLHSTIPKISRVGVRWVGGWPHFTWRDGG